jgi:UDP-N-acetylglucosamine--N-acetylmuramyl-(pentapeptide) pyrophosphoryl-undecaprenol N-acetylglucosamine transferase
MSSEAFPALPFGPGRPFRLIVSGGGTGGHTYPALTTVRTLATRLTAGGGSLETLWVGAAGGLEERVAAEEGITFAAVATGKVRRSSNPLKMLSVANSRDMGRVPLGVAQARSVVSGFRPDVVLATGGYVSVPVGLAAKICRVPLVIHEQTVRLGLANRALAHAATRVALSSEASLPLLPGGARRIAVVTGNPVRPEVLNGLADKAVQTLGLHGFERGLPTVYVTGGAQGARQLNQAVAGVLPWLLERANVIHQCGPTALDTMSADAASLPSGLAGRYHLTGFVGPELPDVLALADVLVSRSGAGTIAEITALGKASVLVPLATSAGGEQAHNAAHLQRAGAAVALLGEVTPETLRAAVGPLLSDPQQREDVARQAFAHARPDAAERLADVVLSAAANVRA